MHSFDPVVLNPFGHVGQLLLGLGHEPEMPVCVADHEVLRQMAEAFQYWLKHAALHELHLSEDETMKVWLYLQDADQHDRYIASKR